MTTSKSFIAISLSSILAYFQPIQSLLMSVTLICIINFAFGLITGVIVNREKFNFKKAFLCISETSVYLCILSTVFFISDHITTPGTSMQAISTITYALIYFYSVNILKNLITLFPGSRPLAWMYNLLSIELIKRLPRMNTIFTKMDKNEVHN
jgi:hypothetical protein